MREGVEDLLESLPREPGVIRANRQGCGRPQRELPFERKAKASAQIPFRLRLSPPSPLK